MLWYEINIYKTLFYLLLNVSINKAGVGKKRQTYQDNKFWDAFCVVWLDLKALKLNSCKSSKLINALVSGHLAGMLDKYFAAL